MSLEARHTKDLDAVKASLAEMRGIIKKIELAAPGLLKLNAELRLEMMTLTSLVVGAETTEAAARMVGNEPPLMAQQSVAELPIFAHGHTLTAFEIEAMQAFRHREGDFTQDLEEDEEVEP